MKTLLARTPLPMAIALAIALAGCAAPMTSHPSPYYTNVVKHLDQGGEVFLYADVDGDLSAGAAYLDHVLERLGKASPDLKLDRVNATRLLGKLGLDRVLAVGLSSVQDGKTFHNKSFLHYGEPRRGLLLLTSAPPRDLDILRQAPGDVDIAFESDLKIKSFLDVMEAIVQDVAGSKAKELLASLDEKLAGTPLSIRQVLRQLDTRLLGVLRVDPKRSFVVPSKGQNITIPGVDFLLGIDNLAMVFDAYVDSLAKVPGVTRGLDGDLTFVEMDIPLPGATGLRPVFAKDRLTGRLYLATSRDFIHAFLADKTAAKKHLAEAADFKKATQGFQGRCNGLSYMSGAFLSKVADFVRPLVKDDDKMKTGLDFFLELLPEAGIPFAAQQVNLPDGLLYLSNSTTSHKSTLFPAMLATPLAVAGAAAAVLASATKNYLGASKAAATVNEPPLDLVAPPAGTSEPPAPPAPKAPKATRSKAKPHRRGTDIGPR